MILLEKLLSGLDVRVETFALCCLRPGELLTVKAMRQPSVHYSLRGSGRLRLADGRSIPFRRHSFIVLPPGHSVVLAEGAGQGDRVAVAQRCGPLAASQGESANRTASAAVLACGRILATYHKTAGLFDHLDEPLVDDFACEDGICRAFEPLLDELAGPRPGTHALVDALMQQCLVLVLRRYCASGECRLPWLSALEDERLGRALAIMLANPEADVTLEGLAGAAGMSRSAFAAHFAATFERSPIEFLKQLRLGLAAKLLRTTDLPVKAVAKRVGYASRSYFSRAFKAQYHIDPAGFRRGPAATDDRDGVLHGG